MKRLHNKLTHRLITLITSAALLAGALPWGATGRIVQADDKYDYTHGLETAPQGIPLNDLFVTGKGKPSGTTNPATIVSATNPNLINKTDVVLITNGTNQVGSIWSNPDNPKAYWDFSRSQKASMWLFFGKGNKVPGDGMALVFQNDERGIEAIGAKGQSLGVYGSGVNQLVPSSNNIITNGIKNSYALEFDTFLNKTLSTGWVTNGGDNSFDYSSDIKSPHIAEVYPMKPSSFDLNDTTYSSGTFLPNKSYNFTMRHDGLQNIPNNQISDGGWHHLSLEWDVETQTFTYLFNDKSPVTGLPTPETTIRRTTPTFDWYYIGGRPLDSKLLWGFTGSTGSNSETAMVIFESIPALLNLSSSITITDLSQDSKPIMEGDTVLPGDIIEYDYNLRPEDAWEDWRDIVADITLNKNIKFTSGRITYYDSHTEEIPASELAYTGKDDTKLKYNLLEDIDKGGGANIRLIGTVTGSNTTVDAQEDKFVGANAVTGTTTPKYKILEDKSIFIYNFKPTSYNVDFPTTDTIIPTYAIGYGDNYNESPSVKDLTNNVFDLSAVLHNNVTEKDQVIPAENIVWEDGPTGTSGIFSVKITPDLIERAGNYTVKVTAKDGEGRKATSESAQIFAKGVLGLSIGQTKSSFKNATLTGETMLINRNNDWDVSVKDTRGTGAGWHLGISALPLKSDGTTVATDAGNLVFLSEDGLEKLLPTDSSDALIIDSKEATKNPDVDEGKNIIKTWTDATGIKARISSTAVGGSYQSVITWTLTDGPN